MNNSKLKRLTIRFSIPGEMEPILRDFMKRVGFYATPGELVESTLAYALWCEQMHHLTGPSFRNRETRQKMWAEVVADYGKEKKTGSYFVHRMEELLMERRGTVQTAKRIGDL